MPVIPSGVRPDLFGTCVPPRTLFGYEYFIFLLTQRVRFSFFSDLLAKFSNCIKVLSPGRNVSTESSTSCMLLDLGTYS